jgi:hypothetical protein
MRRNAVGPSKVVHVLRDRARVALRGFCVTGVLLAACGSSPDDDDPDDPPTFGASQGYSSDLDVNQAFNFERVADGALGFMHSLALGGTTLSRDLIVLDPMDPSRTATVTAVLERVSWRGGVGDAIDFTLRLSGANRDAVIAAAGEAVRDASFSFTVYECYGSCFEAFHTAGQVFPALVGLDGQDQKIHVSNDVNTDVAAPENFTVLLTLVPGNEARDLHRGYDSRKRVVMRWGVTAGR